MASDANLNKQLDVAKVQLYRLLLAKKPETLTEIDATLMAELANDDAISRLLSLPRKR